MVVAAMSSSPLESTLASQNLAKALGQSSRLLQMTTATETSWPGERNPTHEDVPRAAGLPDQAALDAFRDALQSHSDAQNCLPLFTAHSPPCDTSGMPLECFYTYPLSALVRFPDVPATEDLVRAGRDFSNTLQRHIFLDKATARPDQSSQVPSNLLLAYACNGSALTLGSSQDSHALFWAAYDLTVFMVETDNRRSRSLDTILSVSGLG